MDLMQSSNITDIGMYPSLSAYRAPQGLMIDNVLPEFLEIVHPFWHQFPAYSPFVNYLFAVIYFFETIFGYGGNLLVIYIFMTSRNLRTPSNFLIVNLAIADFLMICKCPMAIYNSLNQGPMWGKNGCKLYAGITVLAGTMQALTNVAIAFDRYRTITSPFDGRLNKPKILAILAVIWILSIFPALSPIFEVYNKYVPEGLLTTCGSDFLTDSFEVKSYIMILFIYSYCLPVLGLIFFYSKIVGHVSQHEKILKEQAKKMNVQSLRGDKQSESAAEIRIAKVTIGLFILYLFSWTPYAVVIMMGCFGDRSLMTPLIASIPSLCVKTSSVVDPLVYALNHPKYRLELQNRFKWCCIHEPEIVEDTASTATDKTEKS